MNKEKTPKHSYQPLTKEIIVDGKVQVVTLFHDTDKCRVHKKNKYLVAKEVFQAVVEQLHVFEKIYMDTNEENTLSI